MRQKIQQKTRSLLPFPGRAARRSLGLSFLTGLLVLAGLPGGFGSAQARDSQSAGLAASQGSPAGQDAGAYVLRQEVRAVILDVVVTDSRGNPVPGLRESDFHVTEDGAPQQVKSFQSPEEHTLPGGTATAAAGAPGGLVRGSTGESPVTILLLDEVSTGPEDLAYARSEAERFLKAQSAQLAQPTMLLILTEKQLKVASDFTLDREHLLNALKSDKGGASWYALRDHYAGYAATGADTSITRLRTYLETVSEIAASNAARPGRKNLIWIGPGLPSLSGEGASRRVVEVAGDAVRRASSMLLDARMTLYTIDPQGLLVTPTQTIDPHYSAGGSAIAVSTGQDPQQSELVFEQLAVETGGKIYRMRNDVDAELGESLRDGATYYTLSYTPSNHNYDGKYRRIRVTVDRAELQARTRSGYNALEDVKPNEGEVETTLALALTSSLHYDAIAVSARRLPGAAPARLEVSAGLNNIRFQAQGDRREADVEIVTGLVAENGRVLESHRLAQRATMAAASAAPGETPARATFTVPFPAPGKAGEKIRSVRVLVRDRATGAIGSYDLPYAGA